jgi:predicted transposase YdaD
VDTDRPLKVLFETYAQDLLPLTGDSGARVRRAASVEIQALSRRVDCVLELEREGEVYYRHVEFQAEPDGEMAERCFRYNCLLHLQYSSPVLTTVIYLFPPRPRQEPIFSVSHAGREIHRFRFDVVYLWELDARAILAQGIPGLVALLPLMRGGSERPVIEEAVRCLERASPGERLSAAEDVLLALASQYYTVAELARIVGRNRMFENSSLYLEGLAKGEREICAALAHKHHPAIFERTRPVIESCSDPMRLKEWALAASDLSDADFLRLLGA